MTYPRAFNSAVVLPNGQVLVVGGQTFGRLFSDDNAVLAPELWDPVTERFTTLSPMAVARNYHSVALLLPDARVLAGGGGLCGTDCPANHPDVQILTPYYLLNADGTAAQRPVIRSAPGEATHGTSITVEADDGVASFVLIRLSAITHAVNNDQRRIPVQFSSAAAGSYTLALPGNPGVVLPGHYMLFALDARGVPSISRTVRISGDAAPRLVNPGPQSSASGSPVQLTLTASTPSGNLVWGSSRLPPGLQINATSGVIDGTPNTAGRYPITLTVGNGFATSSTRVLWQVN